jgi:hypothetical protein
MMQKFYVYALVDPRDGSAFYIGKGKNRRMYDHAREAERGTHNRKCNRIRDIFAAGLDVDYQIIGRFDDEKAAYEAERLEIERIGLPNLTNVIPGGAGGYTPKKKPGRWSEKMFQKIAPNLARLLKEMGPGGTAHACGIDITDTINELMAAVARDIGNAAFARGLRPYGVEVAFEG